MPIANVKAEWIDGNQVFKTADGTVLLTFDAANSVVNIPSLETGTFALESPSDFVADVVDVTGTVEDTDYNLAAAAINDIKAALVAGGLMAAS